MELLTSLGINQTFFYQIVIFLIAFFFLKKVVFLPYYKAFEEREKRTSGGQSTAHELHHQLATLEAEYQQKARETHRRITDVFNQKKQAALQEAERIIGEAKKQSEEKQKAAAIKLEQAAAAVSTELQRESGSFAMAVTHKLLGKNN